MKKMIRLALVAAFATMFAGCAGPGAARTAMLTFESSPPGATLYEGDKALGVAPVTRTYQFGDNVSTLATPEVTAVWASGTKTTYWTNISVRDDLAATIVRPANAPGLDKDLAAAQPLLEEKARAAQKIKEQNLRTMARDSARCREQMQKGNVATNDC